MNIDKIINNVVNGKDQRVQVDLQGLLNLMNTVSELRARLIDDKPDAREFHAYQETGN